MPQSRPLQSQPRAFGRAGANPRARALTRVIVWVGGVAGFVGLLVASRYLPHPSAWRAVAIVWFFAAGAANTYYALKRN